MSKCVFFKANNFNARVVLLHVTSITKIRFYTLSFINKLDENYVIRDDFVAISQVDKNVARGAPRPSPTALFKQNQQ